MIDTPIEIVIFSVSLLVAIVISIVIGCVVGRYQERNGGGRKMSNPFEANNERIRKKSSSRLVDVEVSPFFFFQHCTTNNVELTHQPQNSFSFFSSFSFFKHTRHVNPFVKLLNCLCMV